MSAAVERMKVLEAQTAPLPWPVEDFYDMPDDQFQFLVALSQAWPHLRDEINDLETTVVSLSKENAQLHDEHARVVAGTTQLGRDLTECRERAGRMVEDLQERLRVANEERAQFATAVAHLPMRAAAADAVCASIDANKQGSGGAFGWYDGEALDAWHKVAK